jgi:hypothetical protein
LARFDELGAAWALSFIRERPSYLQQALLRISCHLAHRKAAFHHDAQLTKRQPFPAEHFTSLAEAYVVSISNDY